MAVKTLTEILIHFNIYEKRLMHKLIIGEETKLTLRIERVFKHSSFKYIFLKSLK